MSIHLYQQFYYVRKEPWKSSTWMSSSWASSRNILCHRLDWDREKQSFQKAPWSIWKVFSSGVFLSLTQKLIPDCWSRDHSGSQNHTFRPSQSSEAIGAQIVRKLRCSTIYPKRSPNGPQPVCDVQLRQLKIRRITFGANPVFVFAIIWLSPSPEWSECVLVLDFTGSILG